MQVTTERTLCVLVTALFLAGCGGGGGGALASAGVSTAALPVSAATPGASPLTQTSGLQNGVEWPATFTPDAASSVWHAPVSASPAIASYRAAVVALKSGSLVADELPGAVLETRSPAQMYKWMTAV